MNVVKYITRLIQTDNLQQFKILYEPFPDF